MALEQRQVPSMEVDLVGDRRRTIFGVPVTVATCSEAIERLDRHVAAHRSTAVAFFNAHTANSVANDEALRRCLQDFCIFNDGVGIDIASRWTHGVGFPENLNGTDFIPAYLRLTRHAFSIFLLGATPNVVEKAAARLAAGFPRHRVVGWHHGYFRASEEEQIKERIRSSGANLLLVAMGNPKQELWIAQHLEMTGCRVGLAVGALFDFIAEVVPRAPKWVRTIRAEWLFRLAIEPRRLWRRYLMGNVVFLIRVFAQPWVGVRLPRQ